ncbi:hypothetical protein WJX73_007835 [Symbiochloris irregularis]|uniref:RRM domain-containing protein n=1 Tax=Symbiochloris irregularis TaxID=706552 RepID=A0AAW1NR63_9CHLO
MTATPHSNLYVRNLSPEVDQAVLQQLFQPYGQIESCRIVKNARTHASKGYGFVKYSSVESAHSAIQHLHGVLYGGGILEVKFADADAGRQQSGQVPGDNLYVRNIPSAWTDQDLLQLFLPHGSVQDCRLLQGGDASRGMGALVRMANIDEATAAIENLNDRIPVAGAALPLLVRFADTAEEKRAKRANSSILGSASPAAAGIAGAQLPAADRQGFAGVIAAQGHHHPATHLLAQGPSSVYIKNLPPEADKLFLYQRFAPHGAIQSVKVLTDEDSQQCKGVGFVNYVVPTGAMLAVQAMDGVRIGDKYLHVSLQTHSRMRGPLQ